MKKSILAVAALIVVCAGVFFACSKDETKVEDTTVSSSVSSESAVSEESTSEAESQAEQEENIETVVEVEKQASETVEPTGEDTIAKDSEEAASLASEAKKTYDAKTEALIQKFVDSYGYTREAAIKAIEESRSDALAQAEKENKESWAQYNAENKKASEEAISELEETLGISNEEWCAMSAYEQGQLMNKLGL